MLDQATADMTVVASSSLWETLDHEEWSAMKSSIERRDEMRWEKRSEVKWSEVVGVRGSGGPTIHGNGFESSTATTTEHHVGRLHPYMYGSIIERSVLRTC